MASVSSFDGDPLTSATLAFYVLGLLITLVQLGQAARIVYNPVNGSLQWIFGVVLGSVVFLAISYGFRVGGIVIQNSNSPLANGDQGWIAFYGVDMFTRIAAHVLIYVSVFLVVYHRVAIYVGPSSQPWFIMKIVDGVFLGLWALMFIVEVAWILAGYVDLYSGKVTIEEYIDRIDTTRSLDSATSAFFIIVHVAAIVAILMMNSASKNAQDPVVRALMRAMLPVLAFRAIWNIITTAIYNATPPIIETLYQSESINLAYAIIDPLSLAIMIGVMIHVGTRHAFWDIPAGVTVHPGLVTQRSYGAQGMVGGQQGMTMLIGPNGLPILGPNGQPLFAPVGPAPAQGPDPASLEAWKHQSMYSPTRFSATTNPNSILPTYQQQAFLPYGQFVPQQQQFVTSQPNQFAHLPQPPAGYSYQPPGENVQAPQPGSQAFQPQAQQQPLPPLSVGAQDNLSQPRAPLDPSTQPNLSSNHNGNGSPAVPTS